jgi:hypothetical protein
VLAYWLLLAFFAVGALVERPRIGPPQPAGYAAAGGQPGPRRDRIIYSPMLVFGALVTVAMIGLRYKVGGDWDSYIRIFFNVKRLSFATAMERGDPGYQAINWAVAQFGYKVWVVNLICGAIFGVGLLRFCASQARPWLAFAIAIPYLVIVVAMGYTRQAVALGILMAGLARQARGASAINFAFYVAAAALFHSTAIVMFPLVAWSARGNRFVNAAIAISVGIMFYRMFLGDTMDRLITNYLDTAYSSQGALIRVSMNMLAAACFLFVGKRLGFSEHEYRIWRNFSLAAAVMMVLLAVLPSSTAVDRISLYLLPLQLAVIGRLPALNRRNSATTVMAVLAYVIAVQFVWLNYAQFSEHWVPYRLFPM